MRYTRRHTDSLPAFRSIKLDKASPHELGGSLHLKHSAGLPALVSQEHLLCAVGA